VNVFERRLTVTLFYGLGATLAAGLLIYLFVALLAPEKLS
jgi:K+-transporting ATPase KdpF subunit